MSDETRTVLTWACLLVIGFGTWRFWQAERQADLVYVMVGSPARRRIRGRISRGKRFVILNGILMWLALQNLTDVFLTIPALDGVTTITSGLSIRGYIFICAMVAFAIGGDDIYVGYKRWAEDMDFLDK